jgi:Rho-binding antiterminator
MTTDYQPISCAIYSELELAIMHRQWLHLRWREDNIVYDREVLPLDLVTVTGEEYLVGRDREDRPVRLRLDRIQRIPGK